MEKERKRKKELKTTFEQRIRRDVLTIGTTDYCLLFRQDMSYVQEYVTETVTTASVNGERVRGRDHSD